MMSFLLQIRTPQKRDLYVRVAMSMQIIPSSAEPKPFPWQWYTIRMIIPVHFSYVIDLFERIQVEIHVLCMHQPTNK